MLEIPAGTGVHVLRATSLAPLVDAVADVLSGPRADAFSTDVVAVPGAGVQRWVQQRLSRVLGTGAGDGICAGIDFLSLPALRRRVVTGSGGDDADPWAPSRAAWAVLEALDEAAGTEWGRYVTHYLGAAGDSSRPGRRMAAARRIAGLYQRYAEERPEMVLAWGRGQVVDAGGEPLELEDRWQHLLWRSVADRLDAPDPVTARKDLCSRLAAAPAPGLPQDVVLLTPSRTGAGTRELMTALGAHHRVLVALVDHAPTVAAQPSGVPRTSASNAQHRLVRRLGRDGLEQRDGWLAVASSDTVLSSSSQPASSLLGRLQASVTSDDEPPAEERPAVSVDGSLQVHSSHGPDRQVEVLRDVLLRLLDDDPSLEPRDIVVLCPRLGAYAPLLTAAFAPTTDSDVNPGHGIRLRIADRSVKQFNPVLGVLDSLLELVTTRLEQTRVLDFAALPPVAARFGFDDEDLRRLAQLVRRSGIRWGLDAEHRASFGMGQFAQNTWRAGLDRMLVGVALTDEELLPVGATALPLDDVAASDVDLVGRLAELVDRLGTVVRAAGTTHTAREWVDLSREALSQLTDARGEDTWQLTHAWSSLSDLADELPEDDEAQLGLGDARVLLARVLEGMPPRAGFGTGALVACSPDQLRHVPHRVVVLLGFDDAVFPRAGEIDGDDLTARRPLVGDHDGRASDRQLLLDAIMAAGERVVLVQAGASPVTNEPLPPAVPVTEVMDAIDATVVLPEPARSALLHRHPLQPFSPESFGARPSFDRAAALGARALLEVPAEPTVRWPVKALPAPDLPPVLELADLERVLLDPVAGFLRQRVGLWAEDSDPDPSLDEMPTDLDGLQRWAIGDRLLGLVRSGVDLERAAHAEWLRGDLPPRARGGQVLADVTGQVRDLVEAVPPGPQQRHQIDLEVGGLTLRGLVLTSGADVVTVAYSRAGAKHRLRGWVQLLALSAAEPDQAWRWRMVGRGSGCTLGPLPRGWALPTLENLVELYRLALTEPLPFTPVLSERWSQLRRRPEQPSESELWRGLTENAFDERPQDYYESQTSAAFRRWFPTPRSLQDSEPVAEDSGRHHESSRFGTLARRVFDPLGQCEGRS